MYKIARKEKIELAQPFNAVTTTWTQVWYIYNHFIYDKYYIFLIAKLTFQKIIFYRFQKDDLEQALAAIRKGTAVQKAAAEFGIPSGTLYGRCKKVGIELSKATAVHWSEDAMKQALLSVRSGE